jgi:hypothetical protein
MGSNNSKFEGKTVVIIGKKLLRLHGCAISRPHNIAAPVRPFVAI